MNKKMRELRTKIEEKINLAKSLTEDCANKDVEKAETILGEVEELEKEYSVEEKLFKLAKEEAVPKALTAINEKNQNEQQASSTKAFADAARSGFKAKSMNEGTPADGGYVVPEDISTKINKYRDAKASFLSFVRVTPVTTNSGRRTYQKKSQHKGFSVVGEGKKVGKTATPQFETIKYSIKKKAGYLPVTNELLEDSDENLSNTIIEWFGDESRVTANIDIIAAIDEVGKTAFCKS